MCTRAIINVEGCYPPKLSNLISWSSTPSEWSRSRTVLALAVAHTVGVEVTFASALLLGVIATFGACGASGVAGGSLLLIPMACSFFGIDNDVAMQAVAVGFIIGVVQDSVETALNSSGDVFFTAAAEELDQKKKGEEAGDIIALYETK